MNPEDLKVLAERATTVEGRAVDRLVEVHARIAQASRRRQALVVTAVVVAVALAISAGSLFLAVTDHPAPARQPRSDLRPIPKPQGPDTGPKQRPLVWASGRTLHIGDRTIDVGDEVVDVAATDDGALFSRDRDEEHANCNRSPGCSARLWFTDGSEMVRIGRMAGNVVRGYQLQLSSAGSTVVWFEPDPSAPGRNPAYGVGGEYVVYDTAKQREIARFGPADSHVQGVYDDYVYWTPENKTWCLDFSTYYGTCRRYKGIMRVETASGSRSEVSVAAFRADQRSRPRMFVAPFQDDVDTPGPRYHDSLSFGRDGDLLLADDGSGAALTARLARNGAPVRLRLPAGSYPGVTFFATLGWLDDDRVTLLVDNANDILLCRLPDGRCRRVVNGPLIADFAGRG